MRKTAILVLALCLAVLVGQPAAAHRPYFTQVEKIRLPNGSLGEVRLLNGDGIFVADPVRVLVLDAQGHLLAASYKSAFMTLSCTPEGDCLIVDLSKNKVLEFDPSSFREGPVVPGLSDQDRDNLWELEGDPESWGFVVREASPPERVAADIAMAHDKRAALIIIAIVGAFGVMLLRPRARRKEEMSDRLATALRAIRLCVGLAALVASAAVSLWMAIIAGITLELWFISFVAGIGLLILAATIKMHLGKSLRRRKVLDL